MSQDPRPVLLTSGWLLAAARGRKGERGCVRKLSAVLCDNGAVHGRHIWPQWIAGQPFGWPARASRRVGRSSHPEGRSASGGPARRVDGRGRPCVVNAIRAKRGPLVQRHPSPLGVSSTHSPSQCGGPVGVDGRSRGPDVKQLGIPVLRRACHMPGSIDRSSRPRTEEDAKMQLAKWWSLLRKALFGRVFASGDGARDGQRTGCSVRRMVVAVTAGDPESGGFMRSSCR